MSKSAACFDYHRKIVSLETLISIVGEGKSGGDRGRRAKTVVQCHGCFDIVHPGHIRYLQFARSQGDILIVSITGDAAIDKGETRPYIPQELRAENLAALEFVDYVIIDPHPTARELLAALKPDVYVKGQEYAESNDPRFLAERQMVESYGGRVIFSSGQVVFSSTRLIESISQPRSLELHRLSALCRRHDISRRRLLSLIQSMQGRRVLVVGDCLLERYVSCDASAIAHDAPMMSLTELATEDFLGGAADLALQAAALGGDVVLLTGLGHNALSFWADKTLTSLGVHVLGVNHRDDLPINTRFLVDDRKLLKTTRGAAKPLDSLTERKSSELLRDLIHQSHVVIVCDCGYGLLTPGMLKTIADRPPGRKAVISGSAFPPAGELSALRNVDLICCSERRLRSAHPEVGAGLSVLAYKVMQETQATQMMITLGKRGLVTFDRASHDRKLPAWHDRLRSEHLPSLADRAVDRLAVGEAVLTAASLALACDANLMQASYLGAAVAAMRIATVGPVPVTAAEVRHWLANRNELFEPVKVKTAAISASPGRTIHEAHVA